MHIGQSEVAALKAIGKLLVVNPEAVEDRCIEIVHMDFVVGSKVAKLVGGSMRVSAANAAAGEPGGEAVWMMISTKARAAPLGNWSATELARPDDQSVFE